MAQMDSHAAPRHNEGMLTVGGWNGLDWKLVAGLCAIGWFFPLLGTRWFAKIEGLFSRFAANRRLAVGVVFVLPIVIRLALLPLIPLQPPHIHDEFSYLLAADTFAHGRLANLAHPMWMYLDTFHVLQHPTYASMYPPAQGAVLALGQLLGHPWIGVLLSVGAMCAAFLWMLQGWVPARWALLGSLLVLAHFAILSYWMNSYWGGAVAAVGGALVIGAVPRISRKQRVGDAIVLGVGAGILAMSRPLEGFVMCVPVAVVLVGWVARQRGNCLQAALRRFVVPAAAVLALAASFMLYYNWRVTDDPLLFPHSLNVETYHSVPVFMWGTLRPAKQYANRQFEVFYNIFERRSVPQDWPQIKENLLAKLGNSYQFFVGPALVLPLLAFWSVFANKRTRFLVVQQLLCVVGMLAVIWYQPHYLAPALAGMMVVVVQSLRYIRRWQYGGRPVGIGLSRAVLLSVLLMPWVATNVHPGSTYDPFANGAASPMRQQIALKLQSLPGKQLAIVRYSRTLHNIHEEWVYNGADIDQAKVVWAREIPGVSCGPLLDYFSDRQVWTVEPDVYPAKLTPYAFSEE